MNEKENTELELSKLPMLPKNPINKISPNQKSGSNIKDQNKRETSDADSISTGLKATPLLNQDAMFDWNKIIAIADSQNRELRQTIGEFSEECYQQRTLGQVCAWNTIFSELHDSLIQTRSHTCIMHTSIDKFRYFSDFGKHLKLQSVGKFDWSEHEEDFRDCYDKLMRPVHLISTKIDELLIHKTSIATLFPIELIHFYTEKSYNRVGYWLHTELLKFKSCLLHILIQFHIMPKFEFSSKIFHNSLNVCPPLLRLCIRKSNRSRDLTELRLPDIQTLLQIYFPSVTHFYLSNNTTVQLEVLRVIGTMLSIGLLTSSDVTELLPNLLNRLKNFLKQEELLLELANSKDSSRPSPLTILSLVRMFVQCRIEVADILIQIITLLYDDGMMDLLFPGLTPGYNSNNSGSKKTSFQEKKDYIKLLQKNMKVVSEETRTLLEAKHHLMVSDLNSQIASFKVLSQNQFNIPSHNYHLNSILFTFVLLDDPCHRSELDILELELSKSAEKDDSNPIKKFKASREMMNQHQAVELSNRANTLIQLLANSKTDTILEANKIDLGEESEQLIMHLTRPSIRMSAAISEIALLENLFDRLKSGIPSQELPKISDDLTRIFDTLTSRCSKYSVSDILEVLLSGLPTIVLAVTLLTIQRCNDETSTHGLLTLSKDETMRISGIVPNSASNFMVALFKQAPNISVSWIISNSDFIELFGKLMDQRIDCAVKVLISSAQTSAHIWVKQTKITKKVLESFSELNKNFGMKFDEVHQYLGARKEVEKVPNHFSIAEIERHFLDLSLCSNYLKLLAGQTHHLAGSNQIDFELELRLQQELSESLLCQIIPKLAQSQEFLSDLSKNPAILLHSYEDCILADLSHLSDLPETKRLAVVTVRTIHTLLSLFAVGISNIQLPYISNLFEAHKTVESLSWSMDCPPQATLGLHMQIWEICARVSVYPQNVRLYLEKKPLDSHQELASTKSVCSIPSITTSICACLKLLHIASTNVLPNWQSGFRDQWGDGFTDKKLLEKYIMTCILPLIYKLSKGVECTVTVTQNEKLKHSGQVKSYLSKTEEILDWYNNILLPLVHKKGLVDLQVIGTGSLDSGSLSESEHQDMDELSCQELRILRLKCRSICVHIESVLSATPYGFRYIESFDRLNALKRKKSKLDEHLQKQEEVRRYCRDGQMSRYDRIQSLHCELACLKSDIQTRSGGPQISRQQFKAVCEVYELKKLEWSSQENNSFIRFLEERPEHAATLLNFTLRNLQTLLGDQSLLNQLPVIYECTDESSLKPGYFCHFINQVLKQERVYLGNLELLEIALRHSKNLRKALIPPTGINEDWSTTVSQIFLVVTQLVKFLSMKTFHDTAYRRLLYVYECSVDFLINIFEQNNSFAKMLAVNNTSKVKWTRDKSDACMLQILLQCIRIFIDNSDVAQKKFGGWLGPSDKPEHFKLLNGLLRLLLELSSGPCLVVQEAIPQEYLEYFIAMISRIVLDVNSLYYEDIALPAAAFLETYTQENHRVISAGNSEEEVAKADKRTNLLGGLLKSKELETLIVKLIKKLVIYFKLKSSNVMKREINEKLKQDLQRRIELYKFGKYDQGQVENMKKSTDNDPKNKTREKDHRTTIENQSKKEKSIQKGQYEEEDEAEMEGQFLFGMMDSGDYYQQQQARVYQEQQIYQAPLYDDMLQRVDEESEAQLMEQKLASGKLFQEQNLDMQAFKGEPIQIATIEKPAAAKLEFYPSVDLYGLKSLIVKKQDIYLEHTTQNLCWLKSLHQEDFTFNFRDQSAVVLEDLHVNPILSWEPQELIDLYTIDSEFGNHYILKTCIQLHTILINLSNKNEVYSNEAMNRARLMYACFGDLVPRDILIDLDLESQEITRFNRAEASDEIKVFLFLAQVTQKIEIALTSSQGHSIKQVHFQVHPLCMMLTHETRVDFLESRDPENSLEAVIENQKIFEIEMAHNLANIRRGKLFYTLALHDNITFHKYIIWSMALLLNFLLVFSARTNNAGAQDYFIFPFVFFQVYAWFIFAYSVIIAFFWFSSRYRQNVHIARQKLRMLYKSKRFGIQDYFDIYIVRSMLLKSTPQQLFSHMVLSLLSIFVHPFFHTLHLLLLVLISKTAFQIVRSITTHPKQLLVTLELSIIVIYIFAYLVFEFYNKDWDGQVDNNGTIQMCQDMWECIFYSINLGFRSGLGSAFGTPKAHASTWRFLSKFAFNLTFNILINTVILNIVFGIIIDTFANIRDKMQTRKDFLMNYCVICKKSRDSIELEGEDFESHIYSRHYLWKYVNYRVYLTNKNRYDLTTSENMIWRIITEGSTDWIPTEKVLSSIPDMKGQLLVSVEKCIKDAIKTVKDSIDGTSENIHSVYERAVKSVADTRAEYDSAISLIPRL